MTGRDARRRSGPARAGERPAAGPARRVVVGALVATLLGAALTGCSSGPGTTCPPVAVPTGGAHVPVTGRYWTAVGQAGVTLVGVPDDGCSARVKVTLDRDGDGLDDVTSTVRFGERFDVGGAQAMVLSARTTEAGSPADGGLSGDLWVSDASAAYEGAGGA